MKASIIGKSSLLYVLYYISIGIIFLKKNVLRCQWSKSASMITLSKLILEVSKLSIPPIAYYNTLVLI